MAAQKTHWKKLINPDYIGAYALDPGKDLIVTIKSVGREIVTGPDGKKEECTVAHFEEQDVKPMILNSTNSKMIQKIYKTPYIEDWSGRKIQLYVEKIKAFGELVEALRIRPYIPKQEAPASKDPIYCADCGVQIEPFGKMDVAKMAEYTYSKYGKSLCTDCAKAEAEKVEKTEIKDPLAAEPEETEEVNENNED